MNDPHFQVNLNGDTPEAIRWAFYLAFNACLTLEEALADVVITPLHGRNYQTLAFADEARKTDLNQIKEFRLQIEQMRNWLAIGHTKAGG